MPEKCLNSFGVIFSFEEVKLSLIWCPGFQSFIWIEICKCGRILLQLLGSSSYHYAVHLSEYDWKLLASQVTWCYRCLKSRLLTIIGCSSCRTLGVICSDKFFVHLPVSILKNWLDKEGFPGWQYDHILVSISWIVKKTWN